jgi:sugar/nucleoside kinase (ribokinase family)
MSYSKSAKPALIIGSVAIDRVITPFAESANILGGAASFAGIASSYFAPTRILATVGADFPKQYLKKFKKHGIDISALDVVEGGKTFYWRHSPPRFLRSTPTRPS